LTKPCDKKCWDVTDQFIKGHEDVVTDEIWSTVRKFVAQMISNEREDRTRDMRKECANAWDTAEDFDRVLLQWEATKGERAAKENLAKVNCLEKRCKKEIFAAVGADPDKAGMKPKRRDYLKKYRGGKHAWVKRQLCMT